MPGGVSADASLAALSRWRIGGRAMAVVEPSSPAEAMSVMALMADRPEPLFIMGDASNVLFDDAGFDGVVLRISHRMSRMRISGQVAWAEAGLWAPLFARRIGAAGLAGIEHTIGIPGTLGGLILMNGGSNRKGIGRNVREVLCADEAGRPFTLTQVECGFDYRRSSLQQRRAVVLAASFEFEPGDKATIRRQMIASMVERRLKFPKNLPNCGSTFLSDPSLYATVGPPGRAIEHVGLKGRRHGAAQISPLHANFIVNLGGASSADVLWLIALIRREILARTGHLMECEVRHVRADGLARQAHYAADELYGAPGTAELAFN